MISPRHGRRTTSTWWRDGSAPAHRGSGTRRCLQGTRTSTRACVPQGNSAGGQECRWAGRMRRRASSSAAVKSHAVLPVSSSTAQIDLRRRGARRERLGGLRRDDLRVRLVASEEQQAQQETKGQWFRLTCTVVSNRRPICGLAKEKKCAAVMPYEREGTRARAGNGRDAAMCRPLRAPRAYLPPFRLNRRLRAETPRGTSLAFSPHVSRHDEWPTRGVSDALNLDQVQIGVHAQRSTCARAVAN